MKPSPNALWLWTSPKGGSYHEQVDSQAPADAPEKERYRYRLRDQEGDNHGPWKAGRAPKSKAKKGE